MMKNRSEIVGIVLIVIGSLIALGNFNLIFIPPGIISWKLIFILFIFTSLAKGKYSGVVFWSIVASFAYFPFFFSSLHINSVFSLWPLLLIWIGIKKFTAHGQS